jgi:hypothetical protein
MTFFLLLLPTFCFSQIRDETLAIKKNIMLVVNINAIYIPSPDEIKITLNNHSVQVPVRNSRFDVPSEIAKTKDKIIIEMCVNDEIIRLAFSNNDFVFEYWKIYLADKAYSENLEFDVKPEVNVPSLCVVLVDNRKLAAITGVFRECRKKH